MKKFYSSDEERSRDLEAVKKEALFDYKKSAEEVSRLKKKKWIKIILICSIVIIIFKVFVGTIEITNPFTYTKNRFYEVKLNGTLLTVDSTDHHRIPLVPLFIYFNTYQTTVYIGKTDRYEINENVKKYILNINSYSCYSKNGTSQLRCTSTGDNTMKKQNKDTTYTRLYIRKNGRPEKVQYDGPFIEDITPYIQETGYYYINIIAKYENVETSISFNVFNHIKN